MSACIHGNDPMCDACRATRWADRAIAAEDALSASEERERALREALREALRVLRSCPDCGANFEGDPYPWRRDSTTRTPCARCEPARAALSMGKGDGTCTGVVGSRTADETGTTPRPGTGKARGAGGKP